MAARQRRQLQQAPAAATTAPPDLRQHFERLHQLANQQAHRRVLKLSDAILKLAPGDADALAAKAVAQLQLGEYDEAARLLLHSPLTQNRQLALEQAYAAYRTGAYDDAAKLLADVPDGRVSGARQLAAQVAFRRGDGAACAAAYESLLNVDESILSLDAKANALAAFVAGGRAGEVPALTRRLRLRPRDAGHEAMYNAALALALAAEDTTSADEEQWRAIEAAARAAYSDGVAAMHGGDDVDDDDDDRDDSEDNSEVAVDLAPLVLLCAYTAHTARGALGEALGLLEPLLAAGPEGLASRDLAVLAANNWAAAALSAAPQPKGAAARAARRLATAAADDATIAARLGSRGSATLALNRARLALLLGSTDQAPALAERSGAGTEATEELRAVVCARAGKAAEADAMLQAGEGASAPLRQTLLRAQLALEAGDVATALRALDSRRDGLEPAVLATLVALHRQSGNDASAERQLRAALERLQQAGDVNAAAAGGAWCLQQLVALHLAQGKPSAAAALYKETASAGGTTASPAALAQLACAAAAAGDVEGVHALHKRLPASFASLGAGVDAAALEAQAPVVGAAVDRAETAASVAIGKSGRKRKRRRRLPSGHDTSAGPSGGLPPPDPERWLPKWQRTAKGSGAAKKVARERRRAEAASMRGGQGAARIDEALDRGK